MAEADTISILKAQSQSNASGALFVYFLCFLFGHDSEDVERMLFTIVFQATSKL